MRFKQITIVGVGLIGGSFALAARRAKLADRITGWDTEEVLEEACNLGVIDGIEESFDSARVCDADLVYLAAPVGAILSFLRSRCDTLKSGAIVTDAGSTKREICRVARETLSNRVAFVGGHPMAGSHKSGIRHADAGLFRGAPYALVTDNMTAETSESHSIVEKIIRDIGASPVMLSAAEHDQIVARVSHAPQLLSTALACAVTRRGEEAALRLSGSGFIDMVRLAASRWEMWEDICRTNTDQITVALDEVISEIEAVRLSIAAGEIDGVRAAFEAANRIVDRLHPNEDR